MNEPRNPQHPPKSQQKHQKPQSKSKPQPICYPSKAIKQHKQIPKQVPTSNQASPIPIP